MSSPPPAKPQRTPRRMRRIFALEDLEPAAARHLPLPIFGYVEGGAETDAARRDNRAVFDEIRLVPRALNDVTSRDLSTDVLGKQWRMPFGIAPMGVCGLTGYRGDLALASAAKRAGIPMIVSAVSLVPLEEIVAVNPDVWYQAYLPRGLDEIFRLLDRVARCGIHTLVVTVDASVLPNRENNLRTGYRTPLRPSLPLLWNGITHPRWAIGTFLRTFVQHGPPHFENSAANRGPPLLSRKAERDFSGREFLNWDIVRAVRDKWKGQMIVKGLLHHQDVAFARQLGADSVILSNHGGRQLDHAISPMRALPAALAEAGDMPVMLDSGFRRGTDILKAFGLGAKFVFIGRPMNYASALAGEAGVDHAIELMRSQLRADLGMLGLLSMADMGPDRMMLDDFKPLRSLSQ